MQVYPRAGERHVKDRNADAKIPKGAPIPQEILFTNIAPAAPPVSEATIKKKTSPFLRCSLVNPLNIIVIPKIIK